MRSSEKGVMGVNYPVVLGKERQNEVEELETEERSIWGEEEINGKYKVEDAIYEV